MKKPIAKIMGMTSLLVLLVASSLTVFAATPKIGVDVAGGPGSIATNSYAKLGFVGPSDTVTLLESENGYYYIEYKVTTTGELKRGYVPVNTINRKTSEVPHPANYTKTSIKISTSAPSPLTVYTGPGSNFAEAGSVSPSETVSLLSKHNTDYSFIEYNTVNGKKRGFVPANYCGGHDTPPTNNKLTKLLSTARQEIGYIGGNPNGNNTKYGEWFGMNGEPWCSMFVSWVADKSGCKDIIPKTASCSTGVQWFKSRGLWGNTPKPGAIIYFGPGGSKHVGIVESVNNGIITTIEGNYHYRNGSTDDWRVWHGSYHVGYSEIYGYGYPKY